MGTRWLCEKARCLDLEMFEDRLIRTRRLVKSVRLQRFMIFKFSKFSISSSFLVSNLQVPNFPRFS